MFEVEDRYFWYRGMRRIAERVLPELFSAGPVTRVLDVGCGTGANLAHVLGDRSRGARPFAAGTDASWEAILFCRRRALCDLALGSVESLPYRDASFDFVTAHDMLYTVPDDAKALSEIFRVLKPGGRLYITVAALRAFAGEHDRAVWGLRRYGRAELTEKMRRAGFEVETVRFANAILALPILLVRKATSLVGPREKKDAASDFRLTPALVNGALTGILYLEAALMRWNLFPFGVTLVARARKPGDPQR